jgi:Golgi SNAP receptor complex protein 1
MIDGVLSQAYAINESFGLQRETLASINRRIVGAANKVPGMNALIGKIGTKRSYNSLLSVDSSSEIARRLGDFMYSFSACKH